MGSPLFSWTGLYANMLNNSDANPNPAYPTNSQRAPFQVRLINLSGASVLAMCEQSKALFTANIGPDLSETWVCGDATGTQVVAWKTKYWTMLEQFTQPLTASRTLYGTRLRYGANANHWMWFLATHLSAGLDAVTYGYRLSQAQERREIIANLGTDRWIMYSDDNEYFDRAEGDGALVYTRDVAGYDYQFSSSFKERMANSQYRTIHGGAGQLAGPAMIDFVWTQSGRLTRKPRVVNHHHGQMFFTDFPGTTVTYASDHNWFRIVSGCYT